MVEYAAWATATAGPSSSTASTGVTLGLEFEVTAGCWLTGIRWWRSDTTVTGTVRGRVWLLGGTALTGTDVALAVPATGTGWVTMPLVKPVKLSVGQRYRVGVFFPGRHPAISLGYFGLLGPGGGGLTSGPLRVPSSVTLDNLLQPQGSRASGSAIAYPATASGGAGWVTPVVSDSTTGTGSASVTLGGGGTGRKTGVAPGTAPVALAATSTGRHLGRSAGTAALALAASASTGRASSATRAATLGLEGGGPGFRRAEAADTAVLTLASAGSSSRTTTARGSATLTLDAAGEGGAARTGGDTAPLGLAASGHGIAQQPGQGVAALGLAGQGVTRGRRWAVEDALLALAAVGESERATSGPDETAPVTLAATGSGAKASRSAGTSSMSLAAASVTEYTAYPVETGPPDSAGDTASVTLGCEFEVTSTAWITGIRFWRPTTETAGSIACRLWMVVTSATGTAVVGTDAVFVLSGTGWQTATFDPVQLIIGQRYRASVLFPQGRYPATGGYFADGGPGGAGITNGPLFVPGAASAVGGFQNSFSYDGAISYPDGGGSGSYWVTPVVTDVDPAGQHAPGVGTAVLDLAATSVGGKAAAGDGAAGLGLATSGTGQKHATATGVAAFGLDAAGLARKSAAGAQTAALGLDTIGTGAKRGRAVGTAMLGLAVDGQASGAHTGVGTAVLGLAAGGSGQHLGGGVGSAEVDLDITGPGRKVAVATGAAALGLSATGVGRQPGEGRDIVVTTTPVTTSWSATPVHGRWSAEEVT